MKKAAKKSKIEQKSEPEIIKIKRTKIRVIGLGGGGSSIVSGIASRIKKASFVAANTDSKALREVNRSVTRFHFGENLTHGLGTGMNPETGELAAVSEKDKIKKLFEGQDLCVIIACLGGGTGSGAGPIFAKMAKSAGCLTYGIFTMPFDFEGEKKAAIAKKALEELKPRLHAFSVIPNERIFQIIQKDTPLRQALFAINDRLASSLEGLIEIIYEPGLINIDFADLKTILAGQGRLTYLNTIGVIRKEGAVQEAIEKLLNSPLYPYGIRGAKSVLYNIAGEKSLSLAEVGQISKTISELVNKEANIIFGISQNQKYGNAVNVTILATGCGTKFLLNNRNIKPKKEKTKRIKKAAASKERPLEIISKKPAKKKKRKSKNNNAGKRTVKKNPPEKIKIKANNKKTRRLKTNKKKNIPKKIKIKVVQEFDKPEENESIFSAYEEKSEPKVRKNALQVKLEADKEEAEMLAREKLWETPAFLRRKKAV